MRAVIYILIALAAYLISAVNPAIVLSRLIYHTDIRTQGSGNPGFTNFRRVFGARYAWFVFALDLLKAALVTCAGGVLFHLRGDPWQTGIAYAGVFALLGHAFPVFYGFHGGKGFLVCLSTLWVLDWRAGGIATLLMVILLLTTKYMSLSTMVSLIAGTMCLALFDATLPACLMYAACVLFVILRHSANIHRLFRGTETKFTFGHRRDKTK